MGMPQALGDKRWLSLTIGGFVLLVASAMFSPRLWRSRDAAPTSQLPAIPVPIYISGANDHAKTREAKLSLAAGMLGGAAIPEKATAPAPSADVDHKIIRTGSLEAVVKSPAEAAEQIRRLAERLGGYVESAQNQQLSICTHRDHHNPGSSRAFRRWQSRNPQICCAH